MCLCQCSVCEEEGSVLSACSSASLRCVCWRMVCVLLSVRGMIWVNSGESSRVQLLLIDDMGIANRTSISLNSPIFNTLCIKGM